MAVQDDPASIKTLLNNVRNDRIGVVEKSLKSYGLPRSDGETTDYFILQTALRWHHREIAKLLMNAGCRVKPVSTDSGITPLGLAFLNDDFEMALMILQKGTTGLVDSNSRYNILHVAAERKSLKMLELALSYKIDANLVDSNERTALQILLEISKDPVHDHRTDLFRNFPYLGFRKYRNLRCNNRLEEIDKIEMIKLLLSHGASVDFKINNNLTVLHYVVLLKQQTLIKLVLQKIRDVYLRDDQGETALHMLLNSDYGFEHDVLDIAKLFIDKGADIDIVDSDGVSVSLIAASKKYLKILSMFLNCQCNVRLQDNNGDTILHRLLQNSAHLGGKDICTFFVNTSLSAASLENIENFSGKTPLHLAAENCHYAILEKMLPKLENVNATANNGETLLHILLKNPSIASCNIVKRLLNMKASVDMKNLYGFTPLDSAFAVENKNFVLLMIPRSRYIKKINFRQNRSILHYLSDIQVDSESEELEVAQVAKICVAKGACVDGIDDSNRTPISIAVLNQRKNMVEILLKHGADPNFSISQTTVIDYPISKSSTSNDNIKIAHNLVSRGAHTNVTFNSLLSFLNQMDINSHEAKLLVTKLLKNHENKNLTDSYGHTILHAFLDSNTNTKGVCEESRIKVITLLLKNKIEVDLKNNQGLTPLHLAAKNKHLQVSELLLKSGADISFLDNEGNSVLHFVSILNVETDFDVEKNLINFFVSKGCDLNARNKSGMTPLLIAARSGCINVIRALITYTADFKRTDDENLSDSLHIAVEHDYHPIFIEFLLDSGANVYDRRKDGKTALHVAAIHGRYETLHMILKGKIDPDVRDYGGRTALHWVCWHDDYNAAMYLLSKGADINALDKMNVTPLMLLQNSNSILWETLKIHVKRLEIAGVSVPVQSTKCIRNFKNQEDIHANIHAYLDSISVAGLEVSKMKDTLIDKNTSLADVLKMKLDKLATFQRNECFRKLILSKKFSQDFPFYSFYIKACFLRGSIRSKLMRKAQKAFNQLSHSSLLDDCVKEIFRYLDNDNLINLAQAVQLKVSGKKRIFPDKEERIPLKKVCCTNE